MICDRRRWTRGLESSENLSDKIVSCLYNDRGSRLISELVAEALQINPRNLPLVIVASKP
jgi:hypothetical protein